MNRAHESLDTPFDGPGDPSGPSDPTGDDYTLQRTWRDYLQNLGLSTYEIAEELGEDPEDLEEEA